MKNLNIRKLGILLFLPFLLFSCEKWIDAEMNIDPDKPSDVPMEYLLPSIQASMAYAIGGNTAVRTTNIWMQYFDGVDRQSLAEGRYNITSADVNDLWENLYAQPMMDCKSLISKAEDKNSPHYAGVAKVCMATCLGTLTNLFGDIPYSEAFLGNEGNLQPAYESQEDIYGIIDAILEEAIADLNSEENAVAMSTPDPNDPPFDYIFDGDIDLWIKTAYALKARYALNIATKDESIAYTEVLGYIGNAFTSNDDDYEIAYEANISGANANPLYQFMNDRPDMRMSSTFVNTLSDDPRLPFYVAVDLSGEYSGSIPGSENSAASKLGDYSAGVGALTYFSTYSEMKFLEAECKYRLGMIDEAATTFHEAVEASLMKVTNVADSTFMADNVYNINSASINLQKIIEQKYIAMYATVVSYDDWRRTGFPELAPVAGATKATPVRFPYPQSEITYNSNCPVGVQLSEILWIFE